MEYPYDEDSLTTSNIIYLMKDNYHFNNYLLKYIQENGSKLDPTYRDDRAPYGNITPLMLALFVKAHHQMHSSYDNDVFLALIATGNSNIGAYTHYGETALVRALTYGISSRVIIAMIETGEAIPFTIGTKINNPLLRYACTLKMSDVALALIDKFGSNVTTEPPPMCCWRDSIYNVPKTETEYTALDYARLNKMYDVQFVLNKLIAIERRNPAIIAMYINEYL